jgi:hypothetical protein
LKFYQKHKMSNYLIGQASPSPLLSPLWTRQYEHNTASMGDPSGRDLNPADLAVVVGRVSLFLPPPFRQPLKDIHTHPWPGGGSFLGKNPAPSARFELTSAGTATSKHCRTMRPPSYLIINYLFPYLNQSGAFPFKKNKDGVDFQYFRKCRHF